jgi:hypothetical protein
VRRKSRKRVARGRGPILLPPTRSNQRWSMDFMGDTLATGRTFRLLNVVDDFSRECLVIDAATSIPGTRVVRALDELAEIRGLPELIREALRNRYLRNHPNSDRGWRPSGSGFDHMGRELSGSTTVVGRSASSSLGTARPFETSCSSVKESHPLDYGLRKGRHFGHRSITSLSDERTAFTVATSEEVPHSTEEWQ